MKNGYHRYYLNSYEDHRHHRYRHYRYSLNKIFNTNKEKNINATTKLIKKDNYILSTTPPNNYTTTSTFIIIVRIIEPIVRNRESFIINTEIL